VNGQKSKTKTVEGNEIMKNQNIICTTILLALGCFALCPRAQAVTPAPDGGYRNRNTAEGTNALFSLTTGADDTAIGFQALFYNASGHNNTAIGSGALFHNTTGHENTATGALALGVNAIGVSNTATGFQALSFNTTGNDNTAIGSDALAFSTSGHNNTAIGSETLSHNTTGHDNTATGLGALGGNTIGDDNTAIGVNALLRNTFGHDNTAIGKNAGDNQTTGSNNVYIGAGINGIAGESNACRIASIFGQTAASGSAVFITSGNKLGTMTSSVRFKDEIKPMDKASEAILALKPVTFRYKKEVDPAGTFQFGLVAEEVEKVNPNLVVRGKDGKPYSVRYEAVNAMLLNEFLKEHHKVEEQEAGMRQLKSTVSKQEAIIAQQQQGMEALTARLNEQAAQIQKVSTRIDLDRSAPQQVAVRAP
jgi:Chaperone of endosialidase